MSRVRKLMPLNESNNWINKTSMIIDIISEVQSAIEKVDEIDIVATRDINSKT